MLSWNVSLHHVSGLTEEDHKNVSGNADDCQHSVNGVTSFFVDLFLIVESWKKQIRAHRSALQADERNSMVTAQRCVCLFFFRLSSIACGTYSKYTKIFPQIRESCIMAQKIPEFRDIVSFVEFCVKNVPCAVQITASWRPMSQSGSKPPSDGLLSQRCADFTKQSTMRMIMIMIMMIMTLVIWWIWCVQ